MATSFIYLKKIIIKTINPSLPVTGLKLIHPVIPVIIPLKKIKINNDIVLNVGFKDVMIRVAIALIISMLISFADTHLIIYISLVIFYLFISALTRFCIVKYVRHRFIKHEPALHQPKYGKDPNSPEESV